MIRNARFLQGAEQNAYDTNPVNANFSQNSQGRLTTAQHGCSVADIVDGTYYGTYASTTFVEMYSYHPAGGVTAKQLLFNGYGYNNGIAYAGTGTLEADYNFDSAGRVAML